MVVGVTRSSAAAITLTSSVTRSLVTLRRHVTSLRRTSLQNNNRIVSLTTTSAVPDSAVTASPPEEEEEVREWAGMLDIRVGRIVRAWKHPQADSLYVQEVDIGHDTSPTPTHHHQDSGDGDCDRQSSSFRLICSGLVNFLPLPLLQDRKVVVLANLKPRNMRGVKSYGMLMAASDLSHENVELLEPPESSLPGDRIWFGDDVDINDENLPDPASPNQIQKKKIWELVQPHLKTNASCVAVLGDAVMRTSAGVVRCRSLKDANVS